MSDIIQLLPDSVANQIAAGEVIQRPASVVKELVENAIDAGARHINVVVVDAGRTAIQVIDDGIGMSDTDARLAFERHATSKIRQADDLFALRTMGFRGEALASIAAVAQVKLQTRLQGTDLGTSVSISGSRFMGQETVACAVGSNFTVENLFFNVPARRKFLKSNTTELNNILMAFERIVLVYPEIAFTMHSNGVELFNLPKSGFRQRIIDVFGKKLNQDLLSVEVETSVGKISGFVGRPESARKKGAHQYFFVNGRYMRHPYFHKAVMMPYERLVQQGDQVPYFIYLEVSPEDIDVNIHPTKTEIKFENEQALWQILVAAVKEAVGKFSQVSAIDFDTEGKPDIPLFNAQRTDVSVPKVDYNPQYNPFKGSGVKVKPEVPSQWEDLYVNVAPEPLSPSVFNSDADTANGHLEEKSPVHYQFKGRYIMTAVKSGLLVLDQHRASMRIKYEAFEEQYASHSWNTQKVLFPEMIQLPPSQAVVLEQLLGALADVGFEISQLGNGTFAVSGLPTGLDDTDPEQLVLSFVSAAQDQTGSPDEQMSKMLLLTMAEKAALPYGQVLTNEEMENLVNQLFLCKDVNYSPDGKPIQRIWAQSDIERLLK